MLTAIHELLIPQATVLLLSAVELARLAESWREASTEDTMAVDAMHLIEMGCEYVFVTGTRGEPHKVVNTLFNENGVVRQDAWPRISGSFAGAGSHLVGHHRRHAGQRPRRAGGGLRSTGIHPGAPSITRNGWAWANSCSTVTSGRASRNPAPSPTIDFFPIHMNPSTLSRNDTLFQRAQSTTPGGVNSPVRAFRSVGGTPRFITRAEGPYFWDADASATSTTSAPGARRSSATPIRPWSRRCRKRPRAACRFGAPTEGEIEMAEEICRLVPSIEQVRLVSSGTEATMSALRLARGATGRDKIVKFEGCYHGHADSLLVKAGSGLLTFGNPTSAGVPEDFVKHTLVLDYNDTQQLEDTFAGARRPDRLRHRRADRRQHEPGARHAGIPADHAPRCAPSTARC